MTMISLGRRCAVPLALGAALTAAQTPPPGLRSDPQAPIVVTGERLTRDQARERAVTFVRQVGVARGDIAAARWVDDVCPRVLGIARPYAEIVETRMRAIATEAGMRVGRADCRPNITVNFVGDGAALVREIDQRSPQRLREVPRGEREALLNGDAAVRWWYVTETRSRHGMRNAPQSVTTQTDAGGESSTTSQTLDVESMSLYNSSLISTQGNRAIINAAVVVDFDGAGGRSLEAVAAYAAMVAFAEVRPSAPPPTGSILGLFAGEAGARGVTDWDVAFLRALYRLPLDREARRHRGILVREMVGFQTGG